jgi:hypothetical protein
MLTELKDSKGSKATAIYHYIADLSGASVEAIVLAVRGLWALCFVSLTIALDAFVDRRLYTQRTMERWYQERENAENFIARFRRSPSARPVEETKMVDREREETDDDTAVRFRRQKGEGDRLSEEVYKRIRQKLLSGTLSPSVRSLKQEARGADNAYQALDRLQKEGVIFQAANGRYQLTKG